MKCRFLFAATLLSLFCRPADMMGDSLDDLTVKDGVVQIGTAEDFLNFSIAVNEGNSTLNAVLTQDIDSVLPRADVVMSVLPNTAETRYLYTDERFDKMKDSAVFVNCGRGNAVSSEVLYRALKEHKISAAAIDVVETEPLPADSPLWGLENLVITPHISGFFHLPETFERIVDIAAGNLTCHSLEKRI